ncbi:MAG: aspartate--tRNA ligase [Deltaproteobacteria bacterium]|nr:aspartate--tRNA ligase [Deltaproteobacteria bacterium]
MNIDSLGNWERTHDCGALRAENIGMDAVLMGWVNSRRDLGNLIFIDLRDRGGMTQIVFDPQVGTDAHERAHILRNEWVLAVKGKVTARLEGQNNPSMPTGDVELHVTEIRILNETKVPPFQVDGIVDASETLRAKYRYLELRRPKVMANFQRRHDVAVCTRDFLNRNGFMEVETPFLTKSTPEGARDYLVPSRINKGMFYALPQSPQLFKQLLMISGFDRYYQIARCFRDEDLRSDRQPEFTQIDLEMSFAGEEAVMNIFEGLIAELFSKVIGKEISRPIPRLAYRDALERFGTDRPDLRFGMDLTDITDLVKDSNFKVFRNVAEKGGRIKAILVEQGASLLSRKILDELSGFASGLGAKGLLWVKLSGGGWQSPIAKFFQDKERENITGRMKAVEGDIILIVGDDPSIVNQSMGNLRLELARRLGLIEDNEHAFLWITGFPLFEYNEKEGRLDAVHHPFTAPLEEDIHLLTNEPEKMRSRAYDLVLNGVEIGGGSVRIHNIDLQEKIFRILGIPSEEAERKFGFFLEALRYGAPPHAGMAIGFDRMVAIMSGVESIREVIAFPKTQSATCPLTDAPSAVDEDQMMELGLKIVSG